MFWVVAPCGVVGETYCLIRTQDSRFHDPEEQYRSFSLCGAGGVGKCGSRIVVSLITGVD